MSRILHILPADADFQTARCVGDLTRGRDLAANVRTVGRGGDWGNLPAALLGLRRLPPFDIVHAWGSRCLLAAAWASRGRLVFSPIDEPARRAVRSVRAVAAYRQVEVVVPTATWQREFLSRGIAPERCHLIRPGVDFARIRRRDLSLRRELGLAVDDVVLLAAGESTEAANHHQAVWAGSILCVIDPRYKVLLWGRGDRTDALQRLAGRMNQPGMLRIAERRLGRRMEYEQVLAAADMLLVPADAPVPPLPIAIGMAAGLPAVAAVTPTVAELLEDHHTCRMLPPHSPRLLAQRIIELHEDSALRWRLADAARAEAYQFFSLSRFVEEVGRVYSGPGTR